MVTYRTQRIMTKAKTCTRPELTQQIQEAMKNHVPQKNNAALQTQSGVYTLYMHLWTNAYLYLIDVYHNTLADFHRNDNV